MRTYQPAPGVAVITSSFPIPSLGYVPINAYVIDGPEPVLVDTGAIVERAEFMSTLGSVVEPARLRWLWLTHTDADHIGAVHDVMAASPQLRVVTTFVGLGMMSLVAPLPLDRVRFVNAGEVLALPGHELVALRPPVFDNASTHGLFDRTTRILYSADCFGAVLADPPLDAGELSAQELHDGQVFWGTIDSPWLHKVDRGVLARELDAIRALQPATVLCSHLPAADGRLLERLLAAIGDIPPARPYVGPDQRAFEQLLAKLTAVPA